MFRAFKTSAVHKGSQPDGRDDYVDNYSIFVLRIPVAVFTKSYRNSEKNLFVQE